jgi:hypothetical protein
VERQNAFSASGLFSPDHRVPNQPVVGMNDVERPDVVLCLKEVVHERPAHVVDFVYKVGMKIERTTMIMNAVYAYIMRLAGPHARENVDFMSFALESCSQFCNMNSDSADRYGVQRFPRKHRDSHITPTVNKETSTMKSAIVRKFAIVRKRRQTSKSLLPTRGNLAIR